jgi:hypothetical protein
LPPAPRWGPPPGRWHDAAGKWNQPGPGGRGDPTGRGKRTSLGRPAPALKRFHRCRKPQREKSGQTTSKKACFRESVEMGFSLELRICMRE